MAWCNGAFQSLVFGILLIILLSNVSFVVPAIINLGETKNVTLRSTVVFTCTVADVERSSVQWWSHDDNVQISSGVNILVDIRNKYAILYVSGTFNQFNLEVTDVSAEDAVTYMCKAGTDSITSRLYVSGAPVPTFPPPHVIPLGNFTDCCIENGVSEECALHCVAGYTDYDNPLSAAPCLVHLSAMLVCATDNRNHQPCCLRRNVPHVCLGLCSYQPSLDVTIDPVCLNYSDAMVQCAEEGQVLLPSEPKNLMARVVSSTSIFIRWEKPTENGDKDILYRVFYKVYSEPYYRSTIRSTEREYFVNVEPSTRYDIYVVAYNNHGSSLPSVTIEATSPSGSTGDGSDMSSCCQDQGVSDPCNRRFCSGAVFATSDPASFQCFSEINKVFKCLSGQGNHTSCCAGAGLPSECLTLCAGSVTSAGFDMAHCFSNENMVIMRSCISQNNGILPTSPRNLHVTEVLSTLATVVWEEPSTPNDLTNYVVRYQPYLDDIAKKEIVVPSSSNQSVLPLLYPGTRYKVEVFAYNSRGASLPTPSLIFLTYFPSGVVDGVTTTFSPPIPSPPYDVAACCREAGVTSPCMAFCSYDAASVMWDSATVLFCESELGKILKCGTDGRNHTSCCRQRGVPSSCLLFCEFNDELASGFEFGYSQLFCFSAIGDIVDCMENGTGVLPSEPQQLTVVNSTSQSISLSWARPRRQAYNVTYLLEYRSNLSTSWLKVNVSSPGYILQNLQPATHYTMKVMAHNEHGFSLPSPQIRAWTLPDPSKNHNVSVPADVTSCCVRKNVDVSCLGGCRAGGSLLDGHTCTSQLGKIIECAADGRNHRPCCERYNLPVQCLSYCEGSARAADFSTLLCLGFTQQFLACFREGYDKLPSPPHNFHLVETTATAMQLAWEPPYKNGVPVSYILFYMPNHASSFSRSVNVTSPYRLSGLSPFTLYTLYIVAVNEAGTSLPSTTFTVWTRMEKTPVILIQTYPDTKLVHLGSAYKMECIADPTEDDQQLTFYWMRNQIRTEGSVYTIDSVAKTDTGTFICVATNELNVRHSKDVILHVQFAPSVMVSSIPVEPYKELTAQLLCRFKGYPDTISWAKDGLNIFQSHDNTNRYLTARIIREDDGIIESHLSIIDIVPSDYGNYVCTGTNINGTALGRILLGNPAGGGVIRPITPAPAVPNITACCIQKEVRPECMPACSFDINLSTLSDLPGGQVLCLSDFTKILACGADGADHSKCCKDSSVPEVCFEFCAGNIPQLAPVHLNCLSHVEVIVDCLENGTMNVPGPPQNVRASIQGGFIEVLWDRPVQNPEKVHTYTVHYSSHNNPENSTTVPFTTTMVHLKGIHSLSTYTINITAGNHHGESAPSKSIKVTTRGMAPTAPRMLRVLREYSSALVLAWDSPQNFPGAVLSYIVCYEIVGESFYKKKQTESTDLHYNLTGLQPNTPYSIYIIAKSSHSDSDRSNIITSQTSKPFPEPEKQTGMGTGEVVGVAVGVLLLVLLLILALVFAIPVYLRNRNIPHSRFKESVAFENPGYATPAARQDGQISGLPGDSVQETDDGRQDSSAIMKEEPGDTGYVSLNTDQHQPDVSLYATLNVSQPEKIDLAFDEGASGM